MTSHNDKLESLLNGDNANYIDALWAAYCQDKTSVSLSWQQIFEQSPIPAAPIHAQHTHSTQPQDEQAALLFQKKQAQVLGYIQAHRLLGHLHAEINPVSNNQKSPVPELELLYYGLSETDLDTQFEAGCLSGPKERSLRQIVQDVERIYCQSVASEFMHIANSNERWWVQTEIERRFIDRQVNETQQKRILQCVLMAEGLEKYLASKYPGVKRFSLEGCDSLNVALDTLIQSSGEAHTQEIVIGMAHRGRLNVLVNVLGKPPHELFQEFEGVHADSRGSGDVKYHMGYSANINTPASAVHISLAYNPSHLEIVSPVVLGSARARLERLRNTTAYHQVLPILLHGDSAMSGQGVVMETLNMSLTRGYHVGGAVHIITNNQIGFTTSNPQDMRSTLYCSDVAKMILAPIFHVNADDPEAVAIVAQLALDYRMKFKKDVVIDLIGYRRHGHNEADEPAATQPKLYSQIRAMPTCLARYSEKLMTQGWQARTIEQQVQAYRETLDARHSQVALDVVAATNNPYAPDWSLYNNQDWREEVNPFEFKRLQSLAHAISELPAEVVVHPRVAKIYEDRRQMAGQQISVDWGFAESLSYAALLTDGYKVRLTGQDAGRGTFFHRHALLHNQSDDSVYVPLQNLADSAACSIYDSLLSEMAVLGFEYGYATVEPQALIIWEAQFGDFANGAQMIIDQFITSSEQKWGRLSGVTLLLPHGQEGQGPEHSSARLERYLQACAENNIQVCVPTQAAQIFHLMRRQALRMQRKPLIILSPKSGLRNKRSLSPLKSLSEGRFEPLWLDDSGLDKTKISRLVLATGKVCFDLIDQREQAKLQDVGIIRIEQLYPFPDVELAACLQEYPNLKALVWCQEEPQNQGAWSYIENRLKSACPKVNLSYTGRAPMAAPAVGNLHVHQTQQEALVKSALGLNS